MQASSHPSLYFIKCLICEGNTDTQVTDELFYRRIMVPDARVYLAARRMLGDFTVEDFRQDISDTTEEWLRTQGIHLYFRRRAELGIAEKILMYPRQRESIEKMLLGGMSQHDIANILRKEVEFESATVRDIRLYKHYFWNPNLLSGAEMLSFLHKSKGNGFYIEALVGGRDAVLNRLGLGSTQSADEYHTLAMAQLGMRIAMLSSQPFNDNTDKRIVALANTLTRMWKNSKTVGSESMNTAIDRLKRFLEKREPLRTTESRAIQDRTDLGTGPDSPIGIDDGLETDEFEQ